MSSKRWRDWNNRFFGKRAREAVLAIAPHAICLLINQSPRVYVVKDGNKVLGSGRKATLAWDKALNRLSAESQVSQ